MATTTCGICAQNPPKYRCPTCELPYCSIPCFKSHKAASHIESSISSNTATTTTTQVAAQPTHPQHTQPPQPTPTSILTHQIALEKLFTTHPALKHTLRSIYTTSGGTLNKSRNVASAQSDKTRKDDDDDAERIEKDMALFFGADRSNRGGGRGSTRGRGRGRGRGGSAGPQDGGARAREAAAKRRERDALRMVVEARGGENGDGDGGLYGMREFVGMVLGGASGSLS